MCTNMNTLCRAINYIIRWDWEIQSGGGEGKGADVLGMWTHHCDILSVFIYSAPAGRGSRGGLK